MPVQRITYFETGRLLLEPEEIDRIRKALKKRAGESDGRGVGMRCAYHPGIKMRRVPAPLFKSSWLNKNLPPIRTSAVRFPKCPQVAVVEREK